MEHPRQPRLLALLAGTLSEEEATDVFGHVAFCEECEGRLRALETIRADFDGAWERFVRTLGAKAGLAQDVNEAREGLHVGNLAIAVRLLLDGAARVVALGTQHVANLVSGVTGYEELRLCPQYAGVGDPDLVEEIRRLQTEASACLDSGDAERARARLKETEQRRSGASAVAEMEATGKGQPSIRVIADSSRGVVTLLALAARGESLAAVSEGQPALGRAVLLRTDGTLLGQAEFVPVEGADYLLAEIECNEAGEFVVGVGSQMTSKTDPTVLPGSPGER